jgi:MYXO-CTERM domain-containing protein
MKSRLVLPSAALCLVLPNTAMADTYVDAFGGSTATDIRYQWHANFFEVDYDGTLEQVDIYACYSSLETVYFLLYLRSGSSSTWELVESYGSYVYQETMGLEIWNLGYDFNAGDNFAIAVAAFSNVDVYTGSTASPDPDWGTVLGNDNGSFYDSWDSISSNPTSGLSSPWMSLTMSIGDGDRDGYDAIQDCDDTDATTSPGATETYYDGYDQDCDPSNEYDADGDGHDSDAYGGADCDDSDGSVYPGAAEVWYDGVDQSCDGGSDYDQDGDGYEHEDYGGDDCNDLSADYYPGAPDEHYDGVVEDCDPSDEYDADGDGYDSDAYGGTDCDDADATVSPGAEEIWYDGFDQNCDGQNDYDQDGDGHVSDHVGGDDCNDENPDVWQEGDDACDEVQDPTDTGDPSDDPEDDPDDTGNGDGGSTSGGKNCASASTAAPGVGLLALFVMAGLIRRRRR